MNLIDFYKRYDSTQKESLSIHRICNLFSLLRFIFFCLTSLFLLLGYFSNNIGYGYAIVCLIAFLCMIFFHSRYKKRDIYAHALLETYAKHVKRMEDIHYEKDCSNRDQC